MYNLNQTFLYCNYHLFCFIILSYYFVLSLCYFESVTRDSRLIICRYMEGGVATGFRHVERGKYDPRFFLVKKVGRRTEVKQIPMRYKNVNSGDVFIMDIGLTIYQFNGRNSSKVQKKTIFLVYIYAITNKKNTMYSWRNL